MTRKAKVYRLIAVSGLVLILIVLLSRYIPQQLISNEIRSVMLIAGLAMMMLGTLWRVVTEMNDQDDSSSESSSD